MAENRVTNGMKKLRKWYHGRLFRLRGRMINQERARRGSRSFRKRIDGLCPPSKRSWKGPTRFFPRCRKGHPVQADMARCFKCDPLPSGR